MSQEHTKRRTWIVKAQIPNTVRPGKFIDVEMEITAPNIDAALTVARDYPGGSVFIYSATTRRPKVEH